MKAPNKPYRVGLAGLAVIALIAVPTLTYAFDERIVRDVRHFIECAQLQWSDPEAWRANCQPGNPGPAIEPPIPNPGPTTSSVPTGPFSDPDTPSSTSSTSSSSSSSSSLPSIT